MTKKEIVKAISEEMSLTQLKTKEIVQKTFDAIIETLVEDRRIELRNFGVFEVKMRAARKARNPRTGGQVEVPAKFVVTFKPGKEMEEKVRLLEEQEEARRVAVRSDGVYRPAPSLEDKNLNTSSALPNRSERFRFAPAESKLPLPRSSGAGSNESGSAR